MPRFLDPENIYPKRLGVMNGNTIIIEYYDLVKDKFKKHPIPYNPTDQAKAIIDEIYKNGKHFPYLKKVDPKHLKAVLEGQSIKKPQPKMQEREQFEEFAEVKPKVVEKRQEPIFQESIEKQYKQINNDSQISNGKPPPVIHPPKTEEIDDYYAEEFEQFQISQSMEKGSKSISSFSNIEKSKTSVQESSSSNATSKQSSKIQPLPKAVEKPVIEQNIEEEYADDFEFVDQEPKKKEKKQKKQKKEKSKSKEKKPKKQKKEKSSKPQKQVKEVQEQFQFL